MSADNFNFVRQRADGKWDVWLSLSASCETEPQIVERKPDGVFDSEDAAVMWADEQGYTEYGTTVTLGETLTP